MNVIKWSLLLWLGVMLGLLASPFLLVFYVVKGALLGCLATWRHLRNYMGQIKYDCLEAMRRKL